jgi:hypothetical protein
MESPARLDRAPIEAFTGRYAAQLVKSAVDNGFGQPQQ